MDLKDEDPDVIIEDEDEELPAVVTTRFHAVAGVHTT